jgi:hypothetical protein
MPDLIRDRIRTGRLIRGCPSDGFSDFVLIDVWESNILGLVIYIVLYIGEISSRWGGKEGFAE